MNMDHKIIKLLLWNSKNFDNKKTNFEHINLWCMQLCFTNEIKNIIMRSDFYAQIFSEIQNYFIFSELFQKFFLNV